MAIQDRELDNDELLKFFKLFRASLDRQTDQ